jgi:hypothetical protein
MAGAPTPPPPSGPGGGDIQLSGDISSQAILEGLLALYGVLELAGILPDPIALLESLFAGRPREQATIQVAQRLLLAQNPAPKILGIELLRALKQFDLVISATGSGREILNAFAAQFTANLTAQGVPLTRAQTILTNAYSTAAQAGEPLEPELKAPLAQGLALYGPASFAATYAQGELAAFNNHLTGQAYNNYVLKYVLTNQPLSDIENISIQNTAQNTPPPGGTTIPTPTPQPTPTPTPAPQPGPYPFSGPDPDGDEITNDLCLQLGTYFQQLQQALQGAGGGGGGGTTVDLTAVVSALGNMVTALGTIALNISELTGGSSTPVDLTPVVGPLTNLVTAVQAMTPAAPVDLTAIVAALNQIVAKIPANGGTDVSGIVNALNQLVTEGDVSNAAFQFLQQGGFLTPDEVQFYQGMPWADAFFTMLKRYGWDLAVGFVRIFGWDLSTGAPYVRTLRDDTQKLFTDSFKGFINSTDTLLTPFVTQLLDQLKGLLTPPGATSPGVIGVNADTPIAFATAVGFTAAIAEYFEEKFEITPGQGAERIAELIATAIGFEELRDVQIGPLVRNGIAAVAEIQAKATFRQSIPGAGQLADWRARGLMTQAQERALLGYNGVADQLQPIMEQAAYSGMNPRMLLQLIQTDLFTQGDLVDELTFAGVRPASQNRLLTAAPWIATKSERDQLRSALEQAYIAGLLSDPGLTQQLDGLDQNTDRDALVLQRVQLEKRIAFTKELAASYRQEYISNVFTLAQYENFLQGIGLQQDFINTRIAVDQAHVLSIATRKAEAAAAALAKATASVERQAAEKNFMAGNIDQAALAAALVASGLSAVQAVAWTDLAVLRKAGGLRWTYGLQLAPVPAALLRARVSALSDQRKSGVLTDQALFAQLTALGIPQPFLNTIRADANAMIAAKAGAVLIPVDTGQ